MSTQQYLLFGDAVEDIEAEIVRRVDTVFGDLHDVALAAPDRGEFRTGRPVFGVDRPDPQGNTREPVDVGVEVESSQGFAPDLARGIGFRWPRGVFVRHDRDGIGEPRRTGTLLMAL